MWGARAYSSCVLRHCCCVVIEERRASGLLPRGTHRGIADGADRREKYPSKTHHLPRVLLPAATILLRFSTRTPSKKSVGVLGRPEMCFPASMCFFVSRNELRESAHVQAGPKPERLQTRNHTCCFPAHVLPFNLARALSA